MIFLAEISDVPPGLDDMFRRIFYIAGGVLLLLKIWDHFREKPPMDRQVRDLEARLNAKIDSEIDVVSDWVAKDFATKAELDASDKFNAAQRQTKMDQINALEKRIETIAKSMTDQWEQRMRDLTRKLDDFSLDISNRVGELRGETRRMK